MNELMAQVEEDLITELGNPITIESRKPSIVDGKKVKDERGHTVYVYEEIDSIARIKLLKGNESLVKNGVLEIGDAVGIFLLKDHRYLTKKSTVVLHQSLPDGDVVHTNFELGKPIIKEGHLTANLKNVVI